MSKGRPMRRGRIDTTDSEHTIHDDGTYSNGSSASFADRDEEITEPTHVGSAKYKLSDVLVFADGTRWQVLDVKDWGVSMAQMPWRMAPGIQDCTFFTWDEIAKRGGRKA